MDANIAVALVAKTSYSDLAEAKVDEWATNGVEIFAPALWGHEIASGLRKTVAAGQMSPAEASANLRRLGRLPVKQLIFDVSLWEETLAWAARLGQRAAYDASYLALAARIGAEFWTADRALYNGARQQGVPWVHWLG